MQENPEDIARLQRLLDMTMATAGPHLVDIVTPERRLNAPRLCDELTGYILLSLATTTASGRPLVSPVDAIFFRGSFYFSTGEGALRRRHIERDPRVSASYVPRPEFAATVHGVAVEFDHHDREHAAFVSALNGTFVPLYGEGFANFVDGLRSFYRIDADKMYAYWRPLDSSSTA